MNNVVGSVIRTETKPRGGDLYLHVPTQDVYIVAALPEQVVALVSLSTGASWSSYKLFDECQEDFRRLRPGSAVSLTVQEGSL